MSRPKEKDCAVFIRHNTHNVRAARYGKAPLIHLWVHEDGVGGKGIILNSEQAEALLDGIDEILEQIESEDWEPRSQSNGNGRQVDPEWQGYDA